MSPGTNPRPKVDDIDIVWLLTLAYIGQVTWVMNPEPYHNLVTTTITNLRYNYMVMKFHH
jgi:hypothetical protein